MRISPQSPAVKPAVHSFSPNDSPAPSGRSVQRLVSAALAQATPSRLRFRLRFVWADPATPSGQREEIVELRDPRKALSLWRAVHESPDRPLRSARVEAVTLPKWEAVTLDYLKWRAAQRDRREAERAGGAR